MKTDVRELLVFGRKRPPRPPLRLRAGPLTMLFEPDTVFLRRVCFGGIEVLRGVYAAVRDQDWGTVPVRITALQTRIAQDSFVLSFRVECRQDAIHFRWKGQITGAADGTVKFRVEGKALTRFLRNRIGLCVLHPVRECAGVAARQRRTDGRVVECRFPQTIEPQIFGRSSFRDLRAVAHQVAPGLWAEVEFAGEVFEMEDQRNWTDASFKTYCTPLALPVPVEVPAGTVVRQEVKLCLIGPLKAQPVSPSRESPFFEAPTRPYGALPKVGLQLARATATPAVEPCARIAALKLAHLRADVWLGRDRWQTALRQATRQAAALRLPLELAVHLPAAGGEDELTKLPSLLDSATAGLARVLALREGEPASTLNTLQVVRKSLSGLGVPIGGGTDAHFCELNREQGLGRFGLGATDFVSWPITPQVHALDSVSVAETLEAQPDTLVAARAFARGKPLMISPVTLQPRFNAVASGPLNTRGKTRFDPRQRSLFGAAWTLGSLAALARGGATAATFFETTGPGGIMDALGSVFPVYQVLRWLAGFTGWTTVAGSLPDCVASLALFAPDGRRRVLLGNLSPDPVMVRLPRHDNPRVVLLDETTLIRMRLREDAGLQESGRREGIHLLSHAVACIDFLHEPGLNEQ